MKTFEADDAIGCIVITGAGESAFSAGGDIHEQRADDARYSQAELDAMRNPRNSYEISACAKPVIGMMNGLAYGGAAVLASSLDMRIGCEATRFRFLAAAYGRINSTWTLPNQVGWPMAKELLFSARIVEAEEAYRIGLLNHLVPRAKLREKTMELARMIAGNHRGAVMGVKALLLRQKGQEPRRAVGGRAGLYDACDAGGEGGGCVPGIYCAPRPAVELRGGHRLGHRLHQARRGRVHHAEQSRRRRTSWTSRRRTRSPRRGSICGKIATSAAPS